MKFKKPLALLLSATMLMGMTSFAATAADKDNSVSAGNYYNASYLESQASSAYNEQGLGCVYSPASTTWKTWSPDASSVQLKLYKTGSDSESGAGVIGTHNLTKNSTTGVWSITLSGDFKDVYYTYIVTVNGKTNETQDIYSQAVGVNGNRSMVVDLDSTDPEGWDTDKHVLFDSAAEAVVWEAHVRDFSISETSGVSEQNRGKYLAFAEGGTKLNSDTSPEAVSTGIDYLVEQGINCVQLMPVYDFQSVDEVAGGSSTNRNWGYDPQNYNAPEGSYSSNPYDGNVRITEFKQMIQALHDRGISVVMDVVYNHTYTTEGSSFSRTVPNYYYRKTSESAYSNGSGCGNETASDKLMYRKFMIESIKYWAQEYHIDGFRFDLMGIHDITTMNMIRSELDNLYSDGSGKKILMYGEPWTGGTVAISDGCSQSKASQLDARVGMFCDSYRDSIKGGTNDASTGFVQGNNDKTYGVVNGVKGKGFSAKSAAQTIAYADAHDNLILWDKIVKSNSSTDWDSTSASLKGQLIEAMTLVLTSQGIPFMTAGSEFCRTKYGDHNSYKSSDSINAIDWTRVDTYSDVVAYYKGLLEIRKNYTPMKSDTLVTPSFQSEYGYVVAYTYSNSESDEWGKVWVLVNSGTQGYSISTSEGSSWTVVANNQTAGLKSLGTVNSSSYTVPARSAAILVETSTFNRLTNTERSFGTLTVNHVDENGNVLKTSTAKYEEGSTYRALPDSTILFDYELISTEGATSGTVVGGQNYTVTYTYKTTGVPSGTLTVKYVDQNGKSIKDSTSERLKQGTAYDIPYVTIQGYQFDTDNYPANTKGTFAGVDQTITFKYKPLDTTSATVHYYNSNGWSTIRCYAYNDAGEPNGAWASATKMTSEGNNWYVCTVPASSAYVMFHNGGSSQEPGQGENGYLAVGEVWIQNKTLTFSSKVITSHIDMATGQKISADVVENQAKTTSSDTYTTSALAGRTDVITPANASGNYSAGVTNVVYLYTSSTENPTTVPVTTEPITTEPITEPTTTQPTEKILIGDVDIDGAVSIKDATNIQKYAVQMLSFNANQLIAADCDGDGRISVKDATTVQMYIAGYDESGLVGTYVGGEQPTTQPVTTEPITTQPVTTEPVTEPTTTEPVKDTYTVTFTNSKLWSGKIYCYAWTDGGEYIAAWPGTAMTSAGTNDYGQAMYTVEVPSSVDRLIFTNNSSQTIDIVYEGGDLRYYVTDTTDSMGHYEVATW